MRDILQDLEHGRRLSDPDPVRRAQMQMRQPLPKRFYAKAEAVPAGDVHEVRLDGKPALTPGRQRLALPGEAAARLVADEFSRQGETIDPTTMPLTRMVNTALDGVAAQPDAVMEDILRFAGSDLLCYRAEGPEALAERQAAAWDPVLDWAHSQLGARFFLAEGVIHVGQPRETIAVIAAHLRRRGDALRLTALHVMTTLTGSALIALAVEAGALGPEQAWAAAHVDEDWNVEQWGEDAEAASRRAMRKRDFDAAVALIAALPSA